MQRIAGPPVVRGVYPRTTKTGLANATCVREALIEVDLISASLYS